MSYAELKTELLIKGYSHTDIAKKLQVANSTVTNDVDYLEAQENEAMKTRLERKASAIL